MIKIENTEVIGWEAAIRGMRNLMNSWDNSDSFCSYNDKCHECSDNQKCDFYFTENGGRPYRNRFSGDFHYIGPNDYNLMTRLRNAGTDHRKFMRMITVYTDITAPLYWWKEFDTYKVGTVANSCSTMHKIAEKEFTLEDFSCEHLIDDINECWNENIEAGTECRSTPLNILEDVIFALNQYRDKYLLAKTKPMKEESKRAGLLKKFWWQMIQLLPSSYSQKRTVMLNYEVLANIYKSHKDYNLDEWHTFCDWIESLPYYELITGKE